jgi:hypothetical protein
MLVVGEDTVFLSHLPMFGHPDHGFQMIMEVTLEGLRDAQGLYARSRRTSGTREYTLAPVATTLPRLADLMPKGETPPAVRSFRGNLFRHHFERGSPNPPEEILHDVTVNVQQVVHFRQLVAPGEQLSDLEYILFGKGSELFLAHRLTRPPDFDQVLSVRIVGRSFSDSELGLGTDVVIPGRANQLANRLVEGTTVTGEIRLPGGAPTTGLSVHVEAVRELWLEETELREEPDFSQSPVERAAGFL